MAGERLTFLHLEIFIEPPTCVGKILIGLLIRCNWECSALSIFSRTVFSVQLRYMYDLKPRRTLSKSATAFRYKKLERYLFHNISLCIPWHTRTHNCSSRNVQHTFHCSDKANLCMETEKERKIISSCRAIIPSHSVGSVVNGFYFPWYLVFAWLEEIKQFIRVSFDQV